MTELSSLRIGYVPASPMLDAPGDRWRFAAYAKARGLRFEIARPEERYDVVMLTELADITVWCEYAYGKVIYELIDSYLAVPRNSYKHRLRGPYRYLTGQNQRLVLDYWAAFARMCERADAVVCTTLEQKAQIGRYCDNVHIVLDIHTSVARSPKTDYRSNGALRVVWEGLPVNVPQLRQISEPLRNLARGRDVELHLVTRPQMRRYLGHFGTISTADYAERLFRKVRLHAWDERTWGDIVGGCDLAVIPIDLSDPFTAGKPENKLLLLWRIGMPVVTSATPAYRRAMEAAGLSYYCASAEEWSRQLEAMASDEGLRRETGTIGRRYAEETATADASMRAWDAVFRSLLFEPGQAPNSTFR